MAFQFSLQQLLRLRESIEERELTALQLCLREMNDIRAGSQRLQAATRQRRTQQSMRLNQDGVTGAELRFDVDCEYSEALAGQQLGRALAEAQRRYEAQHLRYSNAHRARELLEHLREQQFEAFKRDQARSEQKSADDLFLIRAVNRRP